MKSILIPIDFSPAAYNTAAYGIALAKTLNAERIILYNAYQPYISEDPEYTPLIASDAIAYKAISEEGLEKMRTTFQNEIPASMELILESDFNIVEQGIEEASEKHNAELIIMNLTSTGNLANALFGSTAISLSKHSKTPVLIVPEDVKFSPLQKVLLALDLKQSKQTTPVDEISKILDALNAQLDVLHVSLHEKDTTPDFEDDIEFLKTAFSKYNSQYYIEKGSHLTETINAFAAQHHSDMIIMIPKKHGWFESIFRHSESKAIVLHSHIPVLAIHE